MKDQRGVVYLETLVAFVPVFLFFLGTLQIADASAAHLIVKHAATVAARAAVVVLPDDGVYYNDKDNAQIHQFAGLRRGDIEHAADLVLGANARLDGTTDNVSIGFSAQPEATPAGQTDAEKNASFGQRLLSGSNNRGNGEQNMRELVTARVNAKYTCLVAALCSRGLNMVSEASLVYQGARYIYEARTNGVRNAARPHNTNGGLVDQADQNNDPNQEPNDPNNDADGDSSDPNNADRDPGDPSQDPIAENNGRPGNPSNSPNGAPPGSPQNGSTRPPTQNPSGPVASANPPSHAVPPGSNGSTNNSNASNPSNRPGTPSGSSSSNGSNNSNGSSTSSAASASNSNHGSSSASNNHQDSSNDSKPQIVARPPQNEAGADTGSQGPRTPSGTASNGSANDGKSPSSSSDPNRGIAVTPPSKDEAPRASVPPREGPTANDRDTSPNPGRGTASPRGPPSAQSIVEDTSSSDSDSRNVASRSTSSESAADRIPSRIASGEAREGQLTPDGLLGRDASGRMHLALEFQACFVAGTQVRTPSGHKSIESIATGDRVVAYDTASDVLVAREVVQTFVREAHALVDLTLDLGSSMSLITGTPEHPFYVPALGVYVPMGQLAPGTLLQTDAGAAAYVVSTTTRVGQFSVYNFAVQDLQNYFVSGSASSAGVLVHNTCDGSYPNRPVDRREFIARSVDRLDRLRDLYVSLADPNQLMGNDPAQNALTQAQLDALARNNKKRNTGPHSGVRRYDPNGEASASRNANDRTTFAVAETVPSSPDERPAVSEGVNGQLGDAETDALVNRAHQALQQAGLLQGYSSNPQEFLRHAEALTLLRLWDAGQLSDHVRIAVDRQTCGKCKGLLDKLMFGLGQPQTLEVYDVENRILLTYARQPNGDINLTTQQYTGNGALEPLTQEVIKDPRRPKK